MAIDELGMVHTDDEDEEYEDGVEEGEYEDEEELDDEGEVSDEELDDEDAEYIQGLQPLPRGDPASSRPDLSSREMPFAPQWKGLQELPAATQKALSDILAGLKADGRKQLTVLLIGTSGVGKSSTANSVFKERVAKPSVFQDGEPKAAAVSRKAADFVLTVVDTPSLQDAEGLDTLLDEAKRHTVDAVIWVDRLDVFRVSSLDRQAMRGVTRMLGARVWDYTLIGLTHGRVLPPSVDQSYDMVRHLKLNSRPRTEEFVEQRAAAIRGALRDAGAGPGAELPAVLIENSSRCDTNAAGQQVLPNEEAWLPALMTSVAAMASRQAQPFAPDERAQRKADPNKRWRWLIPVVVLAQVALKVFVLDRLLEEDGVTGDQYGPYDPDFVVSERERQRRDKESRRRRKEVEAEEKKRRRARDALRRRAAAAAQQADRADAEDFDDDEDEEEEDDE